MGRQESAERPSRVNGDTGRRQLSGASNRRVALSVHATLPRIFARCVGQLFRRGSFGAWLTLVGVGLAEAVGKAGCGSFYQDKSCREDCGSCGQPCCTLEWEIGLKRGTIHTSHWRHWLRACSRVCVPMLLSPWRITALPLPPGPVIF